MGDVALFRETATLREWYLAHPPDLRWLGRPTRHLYRWRKASGGWVTARQRVGRGEQLARLFAASPPSDAFVGTSSWLDPLDLPPIRDRRRPAPILLDHLVVFDIDESPYTMRSLDRARLATVRLAAWAERETSLDFVHAVYSGAKGFHLVYRDPDRRAFEIENPREREQAVRERRADILDAVRAAGHPVDRTVTADTRRIIRLPGSLHGSTGWVTTVIPREWLGRAVREWLRDIPRHPVARQPPGWLGGLPRLGGLAGVLPRIPSRRRVVRADGVELQASSHVRGTRDRSALLVWLPMKRPASGDERGRCSRLLLRMGIGPGACWRSGDRVLLLVPRAIPRAALSKGAARAGLSAFGARLDSLGHAWVSVTARTEASQSPAPLMPMGILGDEIPCSHPWSRPHLDLARRLGQPFPMPDGTLAGRAPASMRLVQIS